LDAIGGNVDVLSGGRNVLRAAWVVGIATLGSGCHCLSYDTAIDFLGPDGPFGGNVGDFGGGITVLSGIIVVGMPILGSATHRLSYGAAIMEAKSITKTKERRQRNCRKNENERNARKYDNFDGLSNQDKR
jgi:hypothetical protein